MFFILSSNSIFHSSLKPAEMIMTLLIHFFATSNIDFSTIFAGITKISASTISGNSVIDL
ncbi:MAG: hypothetical protein LBC61_03205 [Candidatus Peribacteria bacterium]|jgi:hypothetical protein|nr:hypothetical protein [Candidatus Peribacteria bacterium]